MATPYKNAHGDTAMARAIKPDTGLFIAFPGTGPIGKTCRDCRYCLVSSVLAEVNGRTVREVIAERRNIELAHCDLAVRFTGKPRRNTNPVTTPACLRFAEADPAGSAEG